MFPFEVLSSEASAANLLQQVRWRDGLYCPHCRSESVIKHGSYRVFRRHLCKDCDRTFNDKTGTIFAHAKIGLDRLLFAFYSFLRFNTSIQQLDAELTVSYRSLRRRVKQFASQRHIVPAKSADESTVRLLLGDREEEPLTIYTDGFRAYDPLEDDENYQREAVIHGEGEYVDGDAHINTCESHASLL